MHDGKLDAVGWLEKIEDDRGEAVISGSYPVLSCVLWQSRGKLSASVLFHLWHRST